MVRAAIYVRVSTQAQGDHGTSLSSQIASCRAQAITLGDEVLHVCQDVDSGADETIPGFLTLLELCQSRAIGRVIIDHPDRLSRSLLKKVMFRAQLAKTGVDVRYVHLPLEDTAEGRLTENMFAALAEYERERIAFRNARGRRAKAARGLVVGNGWAPYGYNYRRDDDGRVVGLEPNEHALIVRRIFELIRIMSTQRVVNTLNREQIPSYHGGLWSDSTVAGILANTAYRGEWAYGRRDSNKRPTDSDTWTMVPCAAIVSSESWDAAQAALRVRRTLRTARMDDDPYLLRGRLTCGYCGAMLACTPNHGHRYYTCLRSVPSYAQRRGVAHCSLPPLPALAIEEHIWQLMQRTVLNPRWMSEVYNHRALTVSREANARQHQARGIERQIERLQGQLMQAMERAVNLAPDSPRQKAAEAIAEKLEVSIGELQERLITLAGAPPETEPAETPEWFSNEVLDALSNVSHDDQREGVELMAIMGHVHDDPDGEPIGRRHRWRIEWKTGDVLLSDARVLKKTRVRFYTPEYDEWEREHLGDTVKVG